jgi:hypothetical protein
VIRAAAWFCSEHCGVVAARGSSWQKPAPSATSDLLALVGRPVKYFTRMTGESRFCLCAASLALKGADWWERASGEIGLLAAGSEALLSANEEYFRDYVASGRTLGRGNLFIYTLATSALGEVAIALSLTGPSMFIQDDARPLAALVRHGEQLVADGEAGGMLALWSDSSAAVCFAIAAGARDETIISLPAGEEPNPLELCRILQARVRRA